jgi:hypothetical protein
LHLAFISAHLIAIPTDSSRCAQREAQAMVLQQVIYNFTIKNYDVIMIGDFNDYDGVVLDMNNNMPTSHVLEILKGNYGDYAGSYQLTNLASNIQQEYRYSDWWDSDNNCNTFIYHGYDEYCGKYNSDHYPVVVDLLL